MKHLGLAALSASLLTLIVVGVFSYRDWRHFRNSTATLSKTRRILQLNQSLLAHLEDAETGQRGFLLTGRNHYLDPYDSAVQAIPPELDELALLTGAEEPDTSESLKTLRPLALQKLEELRRTIELRRTKGLAAALQVVETDFGKRLMDQVRAVSSNIEAQQEKRRADSWSQLEHGAFLARWLALAGAILLAALVVAGTALMERAARLQEILAASAAAARDLLRTTLYSIGDAVITADAEGLVQFMNPVAERLTGYTEKESRGLPSEKIFRIVNEDTRAEAESPIRRVLREGRVVGLANHTVLLARSGQEIPIDDSGAPIRAEDGSTAGVVLVFRDVTARKKAEDALRQSEQRFRMVADSAPVMIWSETPEGYREYFNRPWLEFRGRTAEQELGYGWKEGIHPDDIARHEAFLAASVQARQPFSLEYRLRRADGQYCWVLSRGVPRFAEGGEFLGYIGTCVDIEETKRAETKMREAAKLESLGVLAGGIAHDFNNLLVGIMGGASLLEDYIPANSPARELVSSLEQASERAAKLTKQMLAYAGRGRFFVESLDLSGQVRQITNLISASIPKNVGVRMNLGQQLPAIEADASQIQQVVMNLVINAAEAICGEGWVDISTAARTVGPQPLAGLAGGESLPPGKYIVLTVADNGSGMDAETRAKIFDPFFTTKFTGRGLGLAAVLGIVRGHRGGIRVESEPGKGASFRVYLPVAAAAPETSPQGSIPQFAGTGKVLVVDDEEVVRSVARTALERAGYSVLLAGGGREAVNLMHSDANGIRLILLDMTMPDISGEEALREIRAIRPDVPVVASSGYSEAEALERFGNAIEGFLHKPYSVSDLARAVDAALKKSAR